MRPHTLRLQAFGPFPGEVQVDLDALSAGGLFLLHGDTGAGKTTLLDALGFALYGKVPGARGEQRLRCDTAVASVPTEVTLEVTLSGRRFRIVRRPAQSRPKSRGTGTTTDQARMQLDELRGGTWQSVSTRIDEASAELEPLLGMSSDQFFQVVLLPQGEFAKFLRAGSVERGKLLQRLFGTERFAKVEEWLASRRAATQNEVAAARAVLRQLAARAGQVLGVEPPEVLDGGWVQGGLVTVTALAAQAEQVREAAEQSRERARAHAEQVRVLAARQQRRADAEARQEELSAQGERVALAREEAAAAGRAAQVAPLLSTADEAATAVSAATVREQEARAALTAVGLDPGLDAAALRAEAEQARRRSGRLEELRPLAQELAQVRADEADARAADGRQTELVVVLGEKLAALPERREQARRAVEQAEAGAAALPGARQEVASWADAVAAWRAVQGYDADRAGLAVEHLGAREVAVTAKEHENTLREARVTTMVAELADRLEPGAPCEVCGSTAHPDPYEGQGEGVGREQEDAARGRREQADQEVARLQAELSALDARREAAQQRLDGTGHQGDLPELQEGLRVATAEAAELERLAASLAGHRRALEEAEREQAVLDKQLAAAQTAQQVAQGRADELRGRADRLDERLTAALEGAPDLEGALTAVELLAGVADAAGEATAQVAAATAVAAVAVERAVTAARAAAFPDVEAARAAVRGEEHRSALESTVQRHAEAVAAVAATLADADLAVALDPPADVLGAAEAAAAADDVLAQALAEAAGAGSRLAQLTELAPLYARAFAELEPVEERASRVRRLADLCAGGTGNQFRMTLSSFVLAARLEEVALAASGRLLTMTQGRYALVHSDGAARGGARSGLGLAVRDSWNGRDRDVSTLSGGETFMASLALALGLADVVQAEAGGMHIEALFVDEGFGSLDSETLEEVMDVLDGLREGGRVVGLVSHVAELRQRIPAQVRITKDRAGSTLTVSGC